MTVVKIAAMWTYWEKFKDKLAVKLTPLAERIAVARTFVAAASVAGAVYIDGMDNAVELAYEARPEKLVVVDDAGCVVWKSGIGPYQYSPRARDAWLEARWG
jgi:hypothetical protein